MNNNFRRDMLDVFSRQRKNVPRVYGLRDDIIKLIKNGMIAILHYDDKTLIDIAKQLSDLWINLEKLSLPVPTMCQFSSDIGQEIVEFFFVWKFFGVISNENMLESDIETALFQFGDSISSFLIPKQIVLRGMVDGVTEMSRMLSRDIIYKKIMNRSERIKVRKRCICIAEWMNLFFEDIEMNSIPMVVDAYNHRGFQNSLRVVLNRVREAIRLQYGLLGQEIIMSTDIN